MNFLILNSGSSSVKYKVLSMPDEKELTHGLVEGNPVLIESVLDRPDISALKIDAVAHRVVHGGEKYKSAARVNESVIQDIESLSDIAPMHNPSNLKGILACMKRYPNVPNFAVFDTAFHQTLLPKAYLYGLPYELYEKYRIRKYGFHGISHKFVAGKAMEILKENIKDYKIVSCHLGSGASVCAISKGVSIDNSMGFTPLDGLMMGTRAGSFDPEIVLYLLRKGYSLDQVEDMMLKKGGLKGISQSSNDVRELREEELSGKPKSELAFEMFVYRVLRFIGSFTAILNGVELLIFTGGVGEKAHFLRKRICENLGYLNLKLDARKNRANETVISSSDSDVLVMVIPTDEELEIARESYGLNSSHK